MTAIAIMQPYFVPYSGYFRLFVNTDLFVIYDCVQFPRRGWVHRNRLPNVNGEPRWLTLPLVPDARETQIHQLRFADDAPERLSRQMRKFPALSGPRASALPLAGKLMPEPAESPTDYLQRTLGLACKALGLPFNTRRSSTLAVAPDARGSDRILAILKQLNATRYVNLASGQTLYSRNTFARHNIGLHFLQDYVGPKWSILHRLLIEDAAAVVADIRAQCRYA